MDKVNIDSMAEIFLTMMYAPFFGYLNVFQ